MLEKKLHEELMRFRSINEYGKKLLGEQAEPAPTDAAAGPIPPAGDAPADAGTPPPAGADAAPIEPTSDTEEIDITDLVNMTKSIKKELEEKETNQNEVDTKMNDVFTKLNDLEVKLAEMDTLMSKIDELGTKIETMKPPTPVEKLEMRSLDSYPFNENPQQFFAKKEDEMKASGKNEYELTKSEIQDYSPNEIRQSFNSDNKDIYGFSA
jgi:hypothetical protein